MEFVRLVSLHRSQRAIRLRQGGDPRCCQLITLNRQMVKEIERLRVLSQQRESWMIRALVAEAGSRAKTSNNGDCQNVSDLKYVSLKRYLAKRFHPDYAPGQGI